MSKKQCAEVTYGYTSLGADTWAKKEKEIQQGKENLFKGEMWGYRCKLGVH